MYPGNRRKQLELQHVKGQHEGEATHILELAWVSRGSQLVGHRLWLRTARLGRSEGGRLGDAFSYSIMFDGVALMTRAL